MIRINGIKSERILAFLQKTKLDDGTILEHYENLQIRKTANNETLVQYLKTTTGRVLLNYTIQKTLNFL